MSPGEPEETPGGQPEEMPSGAAVGPAEAEGRTWSVLATIIEIVVIVTAAFVIALLVQAFLVKPFTIHQVSMMPTLEEGDRILLNRLAYRFGDPARGDIVVFHSPINADEDLVKRIVGVPGDRIAVAGGKLLLNGVAQNEPYLLEQDIHEDTAESVVPDGFVYVTGDNRNNSGDSRRFGPVSRSVLIGKAFVVYWPVGRWKGL